jgi:hypothetical protein
MTSESRSAEQARRREPEGMAFTGQIIALQIMAPRIAGWEITVQRKEKGLVLEDQETSPLK